MLQFVPCCKKLVGLGAGSAATGKFCNLYFHLSLKTVSSVPKLTQNFYLYCNIVFFEKWQVNNILSPPLLRTCHSKDYPHHQT